MSDTDKTYLPETVDDVELPVPGQILIEAGPTIQAGTKEDTVYEPATEVDRAFPARVIATETIGTSLNTESNRILGAYEFGSLGAIQVGTYVNGVSGDLRITPSGITARDINGATTFTIDGTTGNATFKGTLQAGTLIGGDSNVIIGTDGSGGRILIYVSGIPTILIGYGSGLF